MLPVIASASPSEVLNVVLLVPTVMLLPPVLPICTAVGVNDASVVVPSLSRIPCELLSWFAPCGFAMNVSWSTSVTWIPLVSVQKCWLTASATACALDAIALVTSPLPLVTASTGDLPETDTRTLSPSAIALEVGTSTVASTPSVSPSITTCTMPSSLSASAVPYA